MSRFSESQNNDEDKKVNRAKQNLSTKKDPMVTRSIRMTERDIKILENHFQDQERTFTQGIRLVIKSYMEKESLI